MFKCTAYIIVGMLIALTPNRQALAQGDINDALNVLRILGPLLQQPQQPQSQQQPQRQQVTAPKPSRPTAEIEADKVMQEALNYFGFDAGPVDGSPGRITSAAVSRFQSTMSNPVTGRITGEERQILADARAWASSNPEQANQVAATDPMGKQGLPAAYRDLASGLPLPSLSVPPVAVAVIPAVQTGEPQTDASITLPSLPTTMPSAEPQAALPILLPSLPTPSFRSIVELCAQTDSVTSTNGGLASPGNMPDPTQALNEQFCLAKELAIADGELISESNKYSQEQTTSTCAAVKLAVETASANYGTLVPDQVLTAMEANIARNGWNPQQVEAGARMCLGEAYETDNSELASDMAIALTAAGREPYAEMVAHHLREGLGTVSNTSASAVWLQIALDALAEGQAPAFVSDRALERTTILSEALKTK